MTELNERIDLLHQRAEKEYRRRCSFQQKKVSPIEQVYYEKIYLAIQNGEFDGYAATMLRHVPFPLAFILNNIIPRADDLIYSAIVDCVNFCFTEKEDA